MHVPETQEQGENNAEPSPDFYAPSCASPRRGEALVGRDARQRHGADREGEHPPTPLSCGPYRIEGRFHVLDGASVIPETNVWMSSIDYNMSLSRSFPSRIFKIP